MTKKQHKSVKQLIVITLTLTAYYIYFVYLEPNFYYFITIPILSIMLGSFIAFFIPVKESNTKRKQKKATKNKVDNNNYKNKITRNRLLPDQEILKLPIEQLSWREFERLCYLYFKAKGYEPRETSEGADGGVDLIIFDRKHNTYIAVQIKHYINSKRTIDVKPIRELQAAKMNHKCGLTIFITSSSYTKDALLQADKYGMETHDINWVKSKIDRWRFKYSP